mmetsp:Transcript_47821/g.144628  ORF Transcript_47821/g.144628 Transcript_47821/m.144628 type:complete len:256 (-) Transcript_47821:1328-2095(-)
MSPLPTAVASSVSIHISKILQHLQGARKKTPLPGPHLPSHRPSSPVIFDAATCLHRSSQELPKPKREAVRHHGEPPNPLSLPVGRDRGHVVQLDIGFSRAAAQQVCGVVTGAMRLEEAQEHGGVQVHDVGGEEGLRFSSPLPAATPAATADVRRTARRRFLDAEGFSADHACGDVLCPQKSHALNEALLPEAECQLWNIRHDVIQVGIDDGADGVRGGRILRGICTFHTRHGRGPINQCRRGRGRKAELAHLRAD